jgi:predicted amino acid racemase
MKPLIQIRRKRFDNYCKMGRGRCVADWVVILKEPCKKNADFLVRGIEVSEIFFELSLY